MLNIIKLLVTNLIGFCTIYLLLAGADGMGFIPHPMPPDLERTFSTWFFGGMMWAWLAGAIVSLLSFSAKGAIKLLLLLLPILAPLLYGLGVLMFFN